MGDLVEPIGRGGKRLNLEIVFRKQTRGGAYHMAARITHDERDSKMESFTGEEMTIFGGAGLWSRVIGKLEVSKELAKHVPQVWKGWRFDTIDLLMSITWVQGI